MNYRHFLPRRNFADVLKHAILARVLTYMKLKPQPFRVIDTHAGAGRCDLSGIELQDR
jgi:23S rRNA (adenine2030-N6)-methyltransferase